MVDRNNEDRTKLIRFLQSSKCKIPWTDREIDEAYNRAAEDLDDYSLEQETTEKEVLKVKTFFEGYEEYENRRSEDIEILHFND